jgi:hypothetical protein
MNCFSFYLLEVRISEAVRHTIHWRSPSADVPFSHSSGLTSVYDDLLPSRGFRWLTPKNFWNHISSLVFFWGKYSRGSPYCAILLYIYKEKKKYKKTAGGTQEQEKMNLS